MPTQTVPNTGLTYSLIAYDDNGRERTDDPDGLMSRRVIETATNTPVTDVFLFSHGWMGDVPEALAEYRAWIASMASCAEDIARIRAVRPEFRPLLIGLHWPSLPWGDDNLAARAVAFAAGVAATAAGVGTDTGAEGGAPLVSPVDGAAKKTADTPAARAALETIFEAARRDIAPPQLPPEVRAAYETLEREIGLPAKGPDAAPGDDREPFNPDQSYRAAQDMTDSVAFAGGVTEGLLSPLRVLSFWRMKDRARRFGEGAAHQLLANLKAATTGAGRDVRFHVMGHSFGCIVVSGILDGPAPNTTAVPIDSLSLIQGALSLWSYTSTIPFGSGGPGYFRRMLDGRVRGPVITTRSRFDRAVGTWYPYAAGVARQVDFAPEELPKYGALGAFGARGPGIDAVDIDMLDPQGNYGFAAGKLYNIEASKYICHGGGFSGAHSDIHNPGVAHAVWQAATSARSS